MKKKLFYIVATLILVDVIVGGYLWLGRTVRLHINETFATAQKNNAINAITYKKISVNFFNDTVTLSDVRTDLNATQLLTTLSPQRRRMFQDGGTLTLKAATLTLSGVWSIILGNTPIIALDGENITLNGAVTLKSKNKVVMSSTIKKILVRGIDLTPLANAPKDELRIPGAKRYDLKNAVFNFTITAQNNAGAQTTTVRYAVASAGAQDITANSWGYIEANGITMNTTFPKNAAGPVSFAIGKFTMANTKLVQGTIIKTDDTIKDLSIINQLKTIPNLDPFLSKLNNYKINADVRVAFDWDLKTRTLTFTKLSLGLKKLGRISTDFVLTNVPTLDVIQSLQKRAMPLSDAEAKNIFGTIAVKRVALEYEDEGILKKIMAAQSIRIGGNSDVLAQAYGAQASTIVNAIYGAAKAKDARTKIIAFLKNPTKIKIGFSTTNPLSVNTLSRMFETRGIFALGAYQMEITN